MCKILRGSQWSLGKFLGFVALLALAGLGGCGGSDPFSYVKVKGTITYEDGSLIPADQIELRFISQMPPPNPQTHPRPGIAHVDPKTGTFDVVTTNHPGDGLVRGEHKVIVLALHGKELRTDLVPPEYSNVATTPLHANTGDPSSFNLKVPKPGSAKVAGK
jgi:hypothetical protein